MKTQIFQIEDSFRYKDNWLIGFNIINHPDWIPPADGAILKSGHKVISSGKSTPCFTGKRQGFSILLDKEFKEKQIEI